jgi:ATP-dependent RNA helicase DeaD
MVTGKVTQPDMAQACHSLGYADTPELVEELARAVERGHHIALIAAEGSGSELLYGLAASGLVAGGEDGLQALVLTATPERAARCARAVHAVGRSRGLEALLWPPRSVSDETKSVAGGQIVVGRPEQVLSAVRAGRLGLAALRLLVIDDVVALEEAWPVIETLLDTCGPDTQKIACAHAPSARLDELIDRQLPRARRWPMELFPTPGGEIAGPSDRDPPVRYALAAGEEALLRRLGEALHAVARSGDEERVAIRCLTPEMVPRVEASLATEGFGIATESEGAGVRVGVEPAAPGGRVDVAVAFGLPARADVLRTALAGASNRLAVVESRHAAQLELTIRRLGWRLEPLGTALSQAVSDELHRFRAEVRSEIDSGDLGGPLLILEPLIEELGAEAVAGALASLLRRRPASAGDAGEAADAGMRAPDANVERVMRRAWTRVFVGVGKRDGAGPGDLVGAITGETGTQGAQIGRIEVRGSYSLVEVDSQVADEVVRRLRGIRIKGRDVTARLDRDR